MLAEPARQLLLGGAKKGDRPSRPDGQEVAQSLQLKRRLGGRVDGQAELVLERVDRACPVDLIVGSDVDAASEALQLSGLSVGLCELAGDAPIGQPALDGDGAAGPLPKQAVELCPPLTSHSGRNRRDLNSAQGASSKLRQFDNNR